MSMNLMILSVIHHSRIPLDSTCNFIVAFLNMQYSVGKKLELRSILNWKFFLHYRLKYTPTYVYDKAHM
jgi:uncharacterized MAPEG superfamily protein